MVRDDPAATTLSYRNLESTMYRARREFEPPIPGSPAEFCQMIPSSQFGVHYKSEVHVGNDIEVIFFSDKMAATLSEVEDIYFDGTFYTVPSQIYQLWTVFARFGRHVLPAIQSAYWQTGRYLYSCSIKNSWTSSTTNTY